MAPRQAKRNNFPKDEKTPSQGIKKGKQLSKKGQLQSPSRKSARLEAQRSQETAPGAAILAVRKDITPIEHWRQEFRWPKEYFEFEPESSMSHLFARPKSPSPSKQSGVSSITPSDQKPRNNKDLSYSHSTYSDVLAKKGSFMVDFDLGISDASNNLCQTLLDTEQSVPQDTLFRTDLFYETCKSIKERNEAMVIRDISLLICPSAQVLRIYGAKHLKLLNESTNEGWNSAIPFFGPRPQPDYSLGFGESAFREDQIEKLTPFVGEFPSASYSYFMATSKIYFPFLTCEVKCQAGALNIADRQNAHSMTLAVRGIVELFRLVGREKELHREILAFSISHDHEQVKIYGHYPVIDGSKTTFYRHLVKMFFLAAEEGRDKWTSYKFTKNVYDIWMPTHLKLICSAIDDLPPEFEGFQDSEPEES